MSGISKHYILHMKDDVKLFDKKILSDLQKIVTWKVTNGIVEPARAEYLQSITDIMDQVKVPWRKRLIALWDVCKKVSKSKTPWSYKLTEYTVRRGRGIHRMDTFKGLSRNYRSFSVRNKKPAKPIATISDYVRLRQTGNGLAGVRDLPPRNNRNEIRLEVPIQTPIYNPQYTWRTALGGTQAPTPPPPNQPVARNEDDWFDIETNTLNELPQPRGNNNF